MDMGYGNSAHGARTKVGGGRAGSGAKNCHFHAVVSSHRGDFFYRHGWRPVDNSPTNVGYLGARQARPRDWRRIGAGPFDSSSCAVRLLATVAAIVDDIIVDTGARRSCDCNGY